MSADLVMFVNTTFPPAFSHLAARLRHIIFFGQTSLDCGLDFECMGLQPVSSGDQLVKNAIGVDQKMAAKNRDRRNRRRGSGWHGRSCRVAGQVSLPCPKKTFRRQEFSAARLPPRPCLRRVMFFFGQTPPKLTLQFQNFQGVGGGNVLHILNADIGRKTSLEQLKMSVSLDPTNHLSGADSRLISVSSSPPSAPAVLATITLVWAGAAL